VGIRTLNIISSNPYRSEKPFSGLEFKEYSHESPVQSGEEIGND
jgi:hypothetical protein